VRDSLVGARLCGQPHHAFRKESAAFSAWLRDRRDMIRARKYKQFAGNSPNVFGVNPRKMTRLDFMEPKIVRTMMPPGMGETNIPSSSPQQRN